MSGRVSSTPPRFGQTLATVSLSVIAFVVAVVAVFLIVMWGESGPHDWGVLVGVMAPIAVSLVAAGLLLGHLLRRRMARAAHIREAIDRELRAMFKTDLN